MKVFVVLSALIAAAMAGVALPGTGFDGIDQQLHAASPYGGISGSSRYDVRAHHAPIAYAGAAYAAPVAAYAAPVAAKTVVAAAPAVAGYGYGLGYARPALAASYGYGLSGYGLGYARPAVAAGYAYGAYPLH